MKINDLFPSNYLRAADLDGDTVVTIKSLMKEEFQGKDKPLLHFAGSIKPLVLNRTNAETIADLYGQEVDGWMGQEITLYPTEVDFRGEPTKAIRVRKHLPVEDKNLN